MVTAEDIRTATNADDIRARLTAMTVPQLNALAGQLDIWVYGNKGDRVREIATHGVQRRLTAAVLSRPR
ncbi:hypothetical protein [Micromonospora sediminicola]|uniref:hypothetical protein n=1 Tax=Micromonospora sediminicola TaxID=946078 RepID=UPI0037AA60AF